jgi:hypothetical protein
VRNPRRDAAPGGKVVMTKGRKPAPKGSAKGGTARGGRPARGGAPQRTSFKGILLRAGIIAAIFYPYIIFVGDLSATEALYTTALAFIILVPLGFLMDQAFYKIRLRRYEKRKSGS